MSTPETATQTTSESVAAPEADVDEATCQELTELTSFQRDCLKAIGVLEQEPRDKLHGLAIKHQLEDWRSEDVNHGRLYPNLDDLMEAGFVEKEPHDRRTNDYRLADRGWSMIEAEAALAAAAIGEPRA